jgi:hypothetical protein
MIRIIIRTAKENGDFLSSFIEKWKSVITDYSDIIILNNLLKYLPDMVDRDVIQRILDLKKKFTLKYGENENNLEN